eukprot:scaffold3073_cov66-Cylindrotheca_fusiformis.AAC.13
MAAAASHAFPTTTSNSRMSQHSLVQLQQQQQASEDDSSAVVVLSLELQQAMERKNKSRQKFGLEPLTGPQFLEMEQEIAKLDQQVYQGYQQQQELEQQQQSKQQRNKKNPILHLFQKGLEDTCLTSFDCESPKVCCDLGFKKMCCSNGLMEVQYEYAMVPVPVDMRQ